MNRDTQERSTEADPAAPKDEAARKGGSVQKATFSILIIFLIIFCKSALAFFGSRNVLTSLNDLTKAVDFCGQSFLEEQLALSRGRDGYPPLPVTIIDISGLFETAAKEKVNDGLPAEKFPCTPLMKLLRVIQAVANRNPLAIAVDADFSDKNEYLSRPYQREPMEILADQIRNPPALIDKILTASDPTSQALRNCLSDKDSMILHAGQELQSVKTEILIKFLNFVIKNKCLDKQLYEETSRLLGGYERIGEESKMESLMVVNRMVLEKSYRLEIMDPITSFLEKVKTVKKPDGERLPIFLGVSKKWSEIDKNQWLRGPDNADLAVDIDLFLAEGPFPDFTNAVSSVRAETVDGRSSPDALPGIAGKLGEFVKNDSKEHSSGLLCEDGHKWYARYEHVYVDTFALDTGLIEYVNAHGIVNGFSRDVLATRVDGQEMINGHIIILGKCEQATDRFILWGLSEKSYPGVVLHAAAVYTLASKLLLRPTHLGRAVFDLLAAVIAAIVLPGWFLSLRRRGGSVEYEARCVERIRICSSFLGAFLVVVVAYLMIKCANILWTDFWIVALAVILHPPIEQLLAVSDEEAPFEKLFKSAMKRMKVLLSLVSKILYIAFVAPGRWIIRHVAVRRKRV